MALWGGFPIYVWSHKDGVALMTKEGEDTIGFMKVKATEATVALATSDITQMIH